MKKLIILFLMGFSVFFLQGCSFFSFTFDLTTTTSSSNTTLPSTINGTISLGDLEYSTFSLYHSDTYDLTDVDQYNDVLLNTRDMIRRSNIQITTTLYSSVRPYPWSTTTITQIVGSSMGSGVIFLEDESYYYALTNYHVVDGEADEIVYEIMTFADEVASTAELVAYDSDLDLAVLKFTKNDRTDIHLIDYTTRVMTKFNPGELVLAVGNPLSVTNNVTFGEYISLESISNVDFQVIYHNAPIHEGSSGGALVDVDGHLLGLNTWGLDSSDEYSFAIPNYIIYMFLVNNGIV